MKGEERSQMPTEHAVYACTVQKCLVLLGTFSLLTGTGVGIWFLVKSLLSSFRLQESVSLQDSDAVLTRCRNVTVEVEEDSKTPFGNANGKKVFFRINRKNFLLEVQVEGRSNRLLLCHEAGTTPWGCSSADSWATSRVNLTDVTVSTNQEFLQVSPNWKENAKERWHIRRSCPSGRVVALKCSGKYSDLLGRCSRNGTICPEETDCSHQQSQECGTAHMKTPEAAGGKDVSLGPWPWQVGLYRNGKRVCGSALLSPEWIVSAAHCVDSPLHLPEWAALIGLDVHTRIKEEAGPALEKVVLHPSYNHGSHEYDLAMLKLKEPLSFSDVIQAVCLPFYHQDIPSSSTCWISGQDYPKPANATVPSAERWATVPVALSSPKDCNSSCRYESEITPRMLCAHYLDGTIKACKGESGGTLVCQHDHRQHLVGIRSGDMGCKQPDRPGVYTNVVELLDWIYHVIEMNEQ